MVMINDKSKRGTVLHFTPSVVGGGAETMLRNLVEAMHGGAWRTVLVTMSSDDKGGADVNRLRGKVDAFYDLEATSYLRPSLWKKLRAVIQKEKPDVVQTWMHRADMVGGLIARLTGVKHVVWGIHSREIYRSPTESDFKIGLYRAALRMASGHVPERILSCSTTAIRDHEGWGFPHNKFTWIPNGISTTRFMPNAELGQSFRKERGIPLDAPVIGFTGRFHPVKDLPTFFKAAALLQTRVPNAHFVMCGGSEQDLEPDAQAALKTLPHPEQVHLIPFMKEPERLYPSFSLLSLCSLSEALPMVLLEAMACGVPCVGTDVGDCKEVIGESGLVVPPRDAAALADAWATMLERIASDGKALSAGVRRRIEEQFSIEHVASRYEQTYESLRLSS